MKIVRIIIHTLALLAGILLILDVSFISDWKKIFLLAAILYSLGNLLFFIILELLVFTLPRFTGVFLVYSLLAYQFLFGQFIFLEQNETGQYLLFFILVFPLFLLVNSLIGIPSEYRIRKSNTKPFKRYSIANALLYLCLFVLFSIISYFIEKGNPQNLYIRILALLVALFPFLNVRYFNGLFQRFQKTNTIKDLNIDFGHLGKLGLIRNFVFVKDRIISTGKYQLTESDYRSTIRVSTALALSRYLADQWNPKYTSLFVRDEFEKLDLKFQVVEKNENGISVINDDATMYHFGNSSYLKNKSHKDDHSNLFLLKNEIPIAKYKINEKIEPEKTAFFNELDYYGNVLLLNSGNLEDLGHDYTIIFDKIYSGINETKQFEILKDLEKKAPTAFFSAKQYKEFPNSLLFYISSKIEAKSNENQIILAPQDLPKSPALIYLSKKLHTLSGYALLILILTQFGMAGFALFSFNKIDVITAITLIIAILTEVFAVYMVKQVNHLPSQPANLAHNHQAA